MKPVRIGRNYVGFVDSLDEILDGEKIDELLMDCAEPVVERAKSLAPVSSGAYRDSIVAVKDEHEDRDVVHIGATVPYSMAVEQKHHVMRKSLG